MSTARVDDIEPIKEFRVYLTKFQEMAGRALSDADSDINKTMRWLEGEAQNHWTSAIRKRQEVLVKAEEALRHKKLYKDASGSTPSVVEEQKDVKKAKDMLEEAQTKLKNVKHWTRALQKESTLYRGAVARFSNDVAAGVPAAIAHLGALLDQLEEYMGITAVGAGEGEAAGAGAGLRPEASEASMARAADEAENRTKRDHLDPEALRETIPTSQAILAAKAGEKDLAHAKCGAISPEQAAAAAKVMTGNAPGDGERIVVSPVLPGATRIVLARLDPAGPSWYLGPVEGPDTGVYNTISVGDLRENHPDLVELLRLPVGFMAVIGAKGIEAIFNAENQGVFKLD